jgi:hypothetical protein
VGLNSGQYRSYITQFLIVCPFPSHIWNQKFLDMLKFAHYAIMCWAMRYVLYLNVLILFLENQILHNYMDHYSKISFGLLKLPNYEKLLYLLTGHDHLLTPIIGEWPCKVNAFCKKSLLVISYTSNINMTMNMTLFDCFFQSRKMMSFKIDLAFE